MEEIGVLHAAQGIWLTLHLITSFCRGQIKTDKPSKTKFALKFELFEKHTKFEKNLSHAFDVY